MATSFMETNRALSKALREQAAAVGVFDHPTAKGDGREDLVRAFLADRVGSMFGVTKAEVVDSNERSTGEFDAVIYDQGAASCLGAMGTRKIVKVEAVAATVEVKSRLDASTWVTEWTRLRTGLGPLLRFFTPLPPLQIMASFMKLPRLSPPETKASWAESEQVFKDGLSPLEDHQNIPAVVSAYFGFDGPNLGPEIQAFLETPCIDIVCVLGKYTIAKRRPGFDKQANGGEAGRGYLWGEGDDALGAFLEAITQALDRFREARDLVAPSGRYYRPRRVSDVAPTAKEGEVVSDGEVEHE